MQHDLRMVDAPADALLGSITVTSAPDLAGS